MTQLQIWHVVKFAAELVAGIASVGSAATWQKSSQAVDSADQTRLNGFAARWAALASIGVMMMAFVDIVVDNAL